MRLDTARPEELLRHERWLRHLVQQVTSPADVDDVVQDTFAAALRRRGHLDRSWFAAVARNLARLLHRRREVRRRNDRDAAAAEPAMATADAVARIDAMRRVAAAVCELPEPHRTTIVQRFHEGLPFRSIAAAAGITEAAARQRVQRGLRLLRERLGDGADPRDDRAIWSLGAMAGTSRDAVVAAARWPWWFVAVPALAAGCLAVIALANPHDDAPRPHDHVALAADRAPQSNAASPATSAADRGGPPTLPRRREAAQEPDAPAWHLVVTVVDAGGAPVPRAIVRYEVADHWCDERGVATIALHGDLAGLDDRITARLGGATPPRPAVVDGLRERLRATSGAVPLRLELGATTSSIRGTVVWEDGSPAAHAFVVPLDSELMEPARLGLDPMRPVEDLASSMEGEAVMSEHHGLITSAFAQVGADGTFELRGLHRPRYRLRAIHYQDRAVVDSEELEIGSAGAVLRLARPTLRTVRGRVVDAAGRPVADAGVCATMPLLRFGGLEDGAVVATARAMTGPDGLFELPDVPSTASAIGARGPTFVPLDVPLPATSIDGVVVRAYARCRLLVGAAARPKDAVSVHVLDAEEHVLPLFGPDRSCWPVMTQRRLTANLDLECEVGPTAAMLQWFDRDGRELRRQPIAVDPARPLEIR